MQNLDVIALEMNSSLTDGNGLTGSISSEIGMMTSLTFLNFCECTCFDCVVGSDFDFSSDFRSCSQCCLMDFECTTFMLLHSC